MIAVKQPETPLTVVRPDKEDKVPRHVAISIKHLQIQRRKAVVARDKAASEVSGIDDALKALGVSVEKLEE